MNVKKIMSIKVNKIRCKFCGDIIESVYRHDFRYCKCQKCFVDGGKDYLRRGYSTDDPNDSYEELSEYEEEE